jgi:hypothetical protein
MLVNTIISFGATYLTVPVLFGQIVEYHFGHILQGVKLECHV